MIRPGTRGQSSPPLFPLDVSLKRFLDLGG
jgi:hypothetical protein